MAYQSQVSRRARGGAFAAIAAAHLALLLIVLNLSGTADLRGSQTVLRTIELRPPAAMNRPKLEVKKTRVLRAGSTGSNINSHATEISAPKPQIQTPRVQQIQASDVPRQGTEPIEGASPSAGEGTGAGGSGSGAAAGTGAGADLGVVEPPRLTSPVISGRDFSADQLYRWPAEATVYLRLRIDSKGYVAECVVDRGTGVPEIDRDMCNMARERLRFRPARNRSGQAVAGWFGYAQPAPH